MVLGNMLLLNYISTTFNCKVLCNYETQSISTIEKREAARPATVAAMLFLLIG